MAKLAIKGGVPVRTAPFPTWPVFDDREVEAVSEVVRSGKWWRWAYGTGVELNEDIDSPNISKSVQFGRKFAEYQGAKFGITVANGTVALDLALKALEIGPGDEVIVTPYSFVASATCILQNNAVPIFVDVEPDTYNIDPDCIEAAITERTRAIIVVHFGGHPVDLDRILEIARKHNLFVIEDAAHAHGSEWRGKRVGALGNIGTFSFQQAKPLTAGEGGLILTNDFDLAEICDSLIWSGRVKGRPWYEFHRLGTNARITEFQAAILLVQLSRLDAQLETKMGNARYLFKALEGIEGIQPMRWDERVTRHSFNIIMLRYKPEAFGGIDRIKFVTALEAEGIPAFYGYTHPIYRNPVFLNKNFYPKGCVSNGEYSFPDIDYAAFAEKCPVTERACYEEAIWLDQRLMLGDREDMDDIAAAFHKIKANFSELA